MFLATLYCPLMYRALKHEVEQLLTQNRLFQQLHEIKKTAVSGLLAAVQLCVLVSVHERTPLDIRQLSRLLNQALFLTDCRST